MVGIEKNDELVRLNENRGQIMALCDMYFWLTKLKVQGMTGVEVLSMIEEEVYKRAMEV